MLAEASGGFELLGIIAAVGALVLVDWLFTSGPRRTAGAAFGAMSGRAHAYLLAVLVFLTLVTAAALPVRTEAISGLPVSGLPPVLPEVLRNTHFGYIWSVRAVTLVVLWSAWLASRALGRRVGFTIVAAMCLLIQAWGWSVTGHPGDHGDFTPAVWAATLHILSAGLWGGTVLAVAIVVFPARRCLEALTIRTLTSFVQRLSTVSAVGLALVVVSGIYNVWSQMDHISSLWGSAYGRVLDLKLALFLVMAGLGADNRFRRMRSLVHAPSAVSVSYVPLRSRTLQGLLRTVVVEAILLLAILATVSVLVRTAPPAAREAAATSASF